ncbi:MAG: ATP synthase F1 subunit delta [Deltaproteobacteria bacterium]|jgi:F-type H+-transporting ATPase subunit delta|nr:ATP synthase F1 subunit delta [Deltaproteobacteria bacterium]
MKRLKTIVRNYSSSAFEVAVESGQLDLLGRDVQILRDLIEGGRGFVKALDDKFVDKRKRFFALDDIAGRLNLLDTTKNLLKVLVQDERGFLLPEIADDFERLLCESQSISVIEVSVSQEGDVDKLQKDLRSLFESGHGDGQSFRFQFKIDKSLVGGFILNSGSYTFDASIKNKLRSLEKEMIGKDV